MAKKTKKNIINTKQLKKLRKDKRLRPWQPLILLLAGVSIGLILAWLQPPNLHPKNLVWASDDTVQVPGDLAEFLRLQDKCLSTQGVGTPHGVGLWSVYHVSKDKFAKISYGCGVGLTRYVMAVKPEHKWELIPPADYFATNFLPGCAVVEEYQVDKSIEPFCIEAGGTPRANTIE